jgi:hypothetical protein
MFREASRSEVEDSHGLHYKAYQALSLARAARATLLAEKQLVTEKVHQAKLSLRASCDAAEELEERLRAAEQQLGEVLEAMEPLGFASTWTRVDMYNFKPRPQAQSPYPCSDDSELESDSDLSDFESYYDARSEFEGSAGDNGGGFNLESLVEVSS